MSETTETVDPLDAMIAQLKVKMAKLQAAVDALEAVRGEGLGAVEAPTAKPVETAATKANWEKDSTLFRAMSIPDASIKLLKLADRPMKNPEIASYLKAGGLIMNSADPVNTIGSVLTRRWQQTGDIVKTGRGTWALKEWTKYVARPKPKNGDLDTEDADDDAAKTTS